MRRVCGLGDVFADLVEEVAEGGGIAGLDDGGEFGELGADLTLTETFLAIGVDELSVSPRAVLPLRNAVRMTDTRESAPRLLAAIDAEYPETL